MAVSPLSNSLQRLEMLQSPPPTILGARPTRFQSALSQTVVHGSPLLHHLLMEAFSQARVIHL
jgi:hypothetical protein